MRRRDVSLERDSGMNPLFLLGVSFLLFGVTACAFMDKKEKPLVPLGLESGAKPQAVTLTEQGTQAYHAKQFNEAKTIFPKRWPRPSIGPRAL